MKRYRPKGQPLRPISEILQTGEAAKIVQQIMDTHDPANASELFATILQAATVNCCAPIAARCMARWRNSTATWSPPLAPRWQTWTYAGSAWRSTDYKRCRHDNTAPRSLQG